MGRARLLGILAGIALAMAGGAPALAAAAQVTLEAGGGLVVTGDATSELLDLSVADGQLALTGLALDAGTIPQGCAWDGHGLACPQPSHVVVRLGAGDDRLYAYAVPLPMTIDDGPGP